MNYEPAKIIIDNKATISMAKCNKDIIARTRHIARRFYLMRRDASLNEHKFHWISTKYQLVDVLTKVGLHSKLKSLWEIPLYDNDTSN